MAAGAFQSTTPHDTQYGQNGMKHALRNFAPKLADDFLCVLRMIPTGTTIATIQLYITVYNYFCKATSIQSMRIGH